MLGHTYGVYISAVNAIGEGALSDTLTVYTGIVPQRMTGASAPVLFSSTSTSITISWLPNTSAETRYKHHCLFTIAQPS